ncbi:S-adenosyl-L-methionine-dependent methyltransferase [Dothidotthia symphoricarpi CBS 119687]|uniref:S-adenosyl-L-methionine-dependent methyltransferase n=1 Tax=Dothidotthia symphoricarpi CBS 119687 TaxID=1392245 RepID=A0A6A6A5L3_9PLEO|nr:S-adenosyl-L-methionine-dependent methyltransferase [Dothidotthia symphoricarpi CBS 119687]KAF2126455.1 S-adenosyl-L-methionine-dependent methyltransferase [Dothidotthia symphoricarpi CBS 119687]
MASNQEISNARFSVEAREWDSNKKHVESTNNAFDAIKRYVPAFQNGNNKDLDVLEIGSGTGLLSFLLAPHVRSLIGVDTAEGMISAFNTKLQDLPDTAKANLCAINHYLESVEDAPLQDAAAYLAPPSSTPPYRFDLIVSHLTLHHIPLLPNIFATMLGCLKPGGMIALTDYEDFGPEAVPFHPISKREGVERHGIDKDEVCNLLMKTGFNEVRVEEAFVLRKEVEAEGGKPAREMDFPFLVCLGVK